MARSLSELTPFVRPNPDGTIYFDAASAVTAKLSVEMVQMGREYEKYHNGLITSVMSKGVKNARQGASQSKFESFFRQIARAGDITGTSPLQMACGGGMLMPHPKKDRIDSNIYKSSREELEAHLYSLGYHRTEPPGCGPIVNCDDFTQWVDAYGCTQGAFRMQANVRHVATGWTYSTQGPEPNPEIMSYSWPAYWWGAYVAWWHARY